MTTTEAVAEKLKGTLRKYSTLVLLKDGRQIEIQTDEKCRIDFDGTARDVFLAFGYGIDNMVRMSEISAWKTTQNMSTD